MTVGAQKWVDSPVSPVRPSTSLCCLVHLDMADIELLEVKPLDVSIALTVRKKVTDELDRLCGPTTLSRAELFGLGLSRDTSCMLSIRDTALLIEYILHVLFGKLQIHAADRCCGLISVLEVHSEVGTLRFDGFFHIWRIPRVLLNHLYYD
jgi:hypothetical protein